MPPIRKIEVGSSLKFIDADNVEYVFMSSDIPQGLTTVQEVEDHINNVWLPPILNGEYQMQAHVFSLSPFVITVFSANLGVNIPANWWIE